jgi:hypothetical protein
MLENTEGAIHHTFISDLVIFFTSPGQLIKKVFYLIFHVMTYIERLKSKIIHE